MIGINFDSTSECEVADTDEARQLQTAIHKALNAYALYLRRCGLTCDHIKNDGSDQYRIEKLIAEVDFGYPDERIGATFDILLEWGASDRCTIVTSAIP
jgi:hypothetical protein